MKELHLNYRLFSGTEEEFLAIKVFSCKIWRFNGVTHRDDDPAVVYSGGQKEWWQNGKLHREDGPAIIWSDGQQWYQNGNDITKWIHWFPLIMWKYIGEQGHDIIS